jgi:hypothetical protein
LKNIDHLRWRQVSAYDLSIVRNDCGGSKESELLAERELQQHIVAIARGWGDSIAEECPSKR